MIAAGRRFAVRCVHRVRGGLRVVAEHLWVLVLAVRVELGLRRRPVAEVASRLGLRLPGADRPPPEVVLAAGAPLPMWARPRVDAVARVMRRWPGGPAGACLRRCLVLGHRLRVLGPELRFGVRSAGTVQAHAWLDVQGRTVDDGQLEAGGYAAFEATPIDPR